MQRHRLYPRIFSTTRYHQITFVVNLEPGLSPFEDRSNQIYQVCSRNQNQARKRRPEETFAWEGKLERKIKEKHMPPEAGDMKKTELNILVSSLARFLDKSLFVQYHIMTTHTSCHKCHQWLWNACKNL